MSQWLTILLQLYFEPNFWMLTGVSFVLRGNIGQLFGILEFDSSAASQCFWAVHPSKDLWCEKETHTLAWVLVWPQNNEKLQHSRFREAACCCWKTPFLLPPFQKRKTVTIQSLLGEYLALLSQQYGIWVILLNMNGPFTGLNGVAWQWPSPISPTPPPPHPPPHSKQYSSQQSWHSSPEINKVGGG